MTKLTKSKTLASKGGAVAEKSAPVPKDIDRELFDAADTEGYYDGIDPGAFAKPFLGILQGLSPACQRGKPEYIEGAQPGLIVNTLTKELLKEVYVTCLTRTHTIAYWVFREDGGGLLREHPASVEDMAKLAALPRDDKRRPFIQENVNGKNVRVEMVECRNFFCLAHDFEKKTNQPVIVSAHHSQLSMARDWNSLISMKSARLKDANGSVIQNLPPVLGSGIWKLGTFLKTKGDNSWYKWNVQFVGLHEQRELVAEVKQQALIARQQAATIDRQLEQMVADPESGGDTPAEM